MTPEELTKLLYNAGALQDGHVTDVAATTNAAFNSAVTHLHVTYSTGARPMLPQAMIMKRNLPADWSVEAGRDEAMFYQLVVQQRERFPMIVPCYVATYDPASGDSLLIMQDISETHHEPVTRA